MLQWKCQHFNELSTAELYAILRLRSEVFVVEQHCVFLDMDDKDQHCWHVSGWEDGDLVAYTRLVPAGISYDEPSIGRVVTSPLARNRGYGRILMQLSIEKTFSIFGKQPIKIGAQLYLKNFYESIGFSVSGPVYLEDGIDHVEMRFPILEN